MHSLARQVIRVGRAPQDTPIRVFSRLQSLSNASKTNSVNTTQGKARCSETGSNSVAKGHVGWSRRASTLAAKGTRSSPTAYARCIVSLDRRNFLAMKQEVFDISEQYLPGLTVHGRVDASQSQTLRLTCLRENGKDRVFPTGTLGVLYFHYIEGDDVNSQLRFRLCRDLDEFPNGSDLLLPDGRTWSRSLQHMARTRRVYSPLLALLSREFPMSPAQIDPNLDSHRIVTTLSPQDLVSKGQKVCDISGMYMARFKSGFIRGDDQNDSVALFFKPIGREYLRFPPCTVGLLYYKQSSTCPAEIGELRFRLCSDPSLFDQGSDLCLPSGDPWFHSSHDLHTNISLRPLANMLYQDGFLKPLDPFIAHAINTTDHPKTFVLTRLSQPFVLDLSHCNPNMRIHDTALPDPVLFRLRLWNQKLHQGNCYRGRMVVQFEKHPDSKRSPIPAHTGPILQLRVLELLTPVVQVGKIEGIARPEPGKLYSVLKRGRYVPWTYAPQRGSIREAFSKYIDCRIAQRKGSLARVPQQ